MLKAEEIRGVLVCLPVFWVACATPVPPPLHDLELGSIRAQYRSYADANICQAEPRWLLDELRSARRAVALFLEATDAQNDGEWTDARLSLLQEGGEDLPPMMEALEVNLERVGACGFGDRAGFVELRSTATAEIAQARRRISQGPELVAYVTSKRRYEGWNVGLARRQDEARGAVCASLNLWKSGRTIYYAMRDELGSTEWWFCDGAQVTGGEGVKPELSASDRYTGRNRRLRPSRAVYLKLVDSYPSESVDVSPPPPTLPAALVDEELPADAPPDAAADASP